MFKFDDMLPCLLLALGLLAWSETHTEALNTGRYV